MLVGFHVGLWSRPPVTVTETSVLPRPLAPFSDNCKFFLIIILHCSPHSDNVSKMFRLTKDKKSTIMKSYIPNTRNATFLQQPKPPLCLPLCIAAMSVFMLLLFVYLLLTMYGTVL